MKKTLSCLLFAILFSTAAQADSRIPWATPQYFTQSKNQRFNHPRLEEVARGVSLSYGAQGEAVERVQGALLAQTSPQPGKKVWQDPVAVAQAVPVAPDFCGKRVRVVVDLSEHRLTVYSSDGTVQRVFPIASGAKVTPTRTGLKVVHDKISDPKPIADKLWPESKGEAFGTRMIDLSWYDPASGTSVNSGEELHGTFVRQSIGCNASHGCVRLNNEDVEWVFHNLKRGDLVLIQD